MPNEITAEELAAKVTGPECDYNAKTLIFAERFLAFTRALASLQAEQAKDAPERVRCWYIHGVGLTMAKNKAEAHSIAGHTVTEGYFTAKGSTDD